MKEFAARMLTALTVGIGGQALWLGTAMAHTGEDATPRHVVVEFGLWTLGVLAIVLVVVGIFWIRSKVRPR